ncbi:putative Alkaline phosphatase [Streptomyces misionensis JCM 4497]
MSHRTTAQPRSRRAQARPGSHRTARPAAGQRPAARRPPLLGPGHRPRPGGGHRRPAGPGRGRDQRGARRGRRGRHRLREGHRPRARGQAGRRLGAHPRHPRTARRRRRPARARRSGLGRGRRRRRPRRGRQAARHVRPRGRAGGRRGAQHSRLPRRPHPSARPGALHGLPRLGPGLQPRRDRPHHGRGRLHRHHQGQPAAQPPRRRTLPDGAAGLDPARQRRPARHPGDRHRRGGTRLADHHPGHHALRQRRPPHQLHHAALCGHRRARRGPRRHSRQRRRRLRHRGQPRGRHRSRRPLRTGDRQGVRPRRRPLPRRGGVRPPRRALRPDDAPPGHRRRSGLTRSPPPDRPATGPAGRRACPGRHRARWPASGPGPDHPAPSDHQVRSEPARPPTTATTRPPGPGAAPGHPFPSTGARHDPLPGRADRRRGRRATAPQSLRAGHPRGDRAALRTGRGHRARADHDARHRTQHLGHRRAHRDAGGPRLLRRAAPDARPQPPEPGAVRRLGVDLRGGQLAGDAHRGALPTGPHRPGLADARRRGDRPRRGQLGAVPGVRLPAAAGHRGLARGHRRCRDHPCRRRGRPEGEAARCQRARRLRRGPVQSAHQRGRRRLPRQHLGAADVRRRPAGRPVRTGPPARRPLRALRSARRDDRRRTRRPRAGPADDEEPRGTEDCRGRRRAGHRGGRPGRRAGERPARALRARGAHRRRRPTAPRPAGGAGALRRRRAGHRPHGRRAVRHGRGRPGRLGAPRRRRRAGAPADRGAGGHALRLVPGLRGHPHLFDPGTRPGHPDGAAGPARRLRGLHRACLRRRRFRLQGWLAAAPRRRALAPVRGGRPPAAVPRAARGLRRGGARGGRGLEAVLRRRTRAARRQGLRRHHQDRPHRRARPGGYGTVGHSRRAGPAARRLLAADGRPAGHRTARGHPAGRLAGAGGPGGTGAVAAARTPKGGGRGGGAGRHRGGRQRPGAGRGRPGGGQLAQRREPDRQDLLTARPARATAYRADAHPRQIPVRHREAKEGQR